MVNFPTLIHRSSRQIPLYLKNIAVFDVMKYWYSEGIQQIFDDKNDRLNALFMLVEWYLNFLLIKYWYLIRMGYDMDIKDLIEDIGYSPRRKAACHGGEYCSPCPFCKDGKDRFLIWPNRHNKNGEYQGGRYIANIT